MTTQTYKGLELNLAPLMERRSRPAADADIAGDWSRLEAVMDMVGLLLTLEEGDALRLRLLVTRDACRSLLRK